MAGSQLKKSLLILLLKMQGYSTREIAAEQGAAGYERYFEGNEENRYIWSENSVRGILRSPIYAGNLAGYKRKQEETPRHQPFCRYGGE